MNTQTKTIYDVTFIEGEGEPRTSILEHEYHHVWHVRDPDQVPEGRVLREGINKVIECSEKELRFPPAVRVIQIAGQKPQAKPLWNYGKNKI